MYRIRVVPLFLPRLADRDGDVEALAWHFIDQFNESAPRTIEGIDSTAMNALVSYGWPGNIRELRNVIEYAFAVGVGEILTIDELTPELRGEEPNTDSYSSQLSTLEAMERRQVLEALEKANGKRSEAADILDVSRSTLWRRMKELGIS